MADLMGFPTKLETATSSSSTRSTACRAPSKSTCIPRWRTSRSTSCWTRGRSPRRSASRQAVHPGRRDDAGLLASPLRDRFGLLFHLDFYTPAELEAIVRRSANLLGVEIDADAASEIARRSRGTPRIANRLLRRVRDYAQVKGEGSVDIEVTRASLQLEGVDDEGLDELDRKVIDAIISRYNGGPAGIEALAATLQEETDTLTDVVEPFLLQQGFLIRTSSGRRATARAYDHLGVARPRSMPADQPPLL